MSIHDLFLIYVVCEAEVLIVYRKNVDMVLLLLAPVVTLIHVPLGIAKCYLGIEKLIKFITKKMSRHGEKS